MEGSEKRLKSEYDDQSEESPEITKRPKADRRWYKRMISKPIDPGAPAWILNLRVIFEERYWNYLDAKNGNSNSIVVKKPAELREKLEIEAKDYLQLVPQQIKFYDNKFIYDTISELAKHDTECNNLELICADFRTIEDLSTNLMNFPGKFKNVSFGSYGSLTFDSSDRVWLQNVEKFGFHSMELGLKLIYHLGFSAPSQSGGSKLFLQGPLDKFWVNEFARDCVMAAQECKIGALIRKTVSEKFACTWEDVFRFRFRFSGTVEQAARELSLIKSNHKYQHNAKLLENYIEKKEREKENFILQQNQVKKDMAEITLKYEDLVKKHESQPKLNSD